MKIGRAVSVIELSERGESGPVFWSSPYLASELGFAVAAVMVIATAVVLMAGITKPIPAAVLLGVGVYYLDGHAGARLSAARDARLTAASRS